MIRRPGDGPPLLEEVDFSAAAGSLTAVTGRSGSGKSTFLAVLGGLIAPAAGLVTWNGLPIWKVSTRARHAASRRQVGWMFQQDNLITSLSVRDNVALPLRLQRSRSWRAAADDALDVVGLASRGHLSPPELSGGERQRVAVARLIAAPRPIALVDEPTSSLDVVSAATVHGALHALSAVGTAVVVVTHDLDLAVSADRTFIVSERSLRDCTGCDRSGLRDVLRSDS